MESDSWALFTNCISMVLYKGEESFIFTPRLKKDQLDKLVRGDDIHFITYTNSYCKRQGIRIDIYSDGKDINFLIEDQCISIPFRHVNLFGYLKTD